MGHVAAQKTARTTLGCPGSLGSQYNADLGIIPLRIDVYSRKNVASFKAALQGLMAEVRAGIGINNVSFLLVTHVPRDRRRPRRAVAGLRHRRPRARREDTDGTPGLSGALHYDLGDIFIGPGMTNALGYSASTGKIHLHDARPLHSGPRHLQPAGACRSRS